MFTSLKYSLRTIGLLALFPALTASAQVFVGSEDFNNGGTASNWDSVYRLNSATQGDLTFANNRLDFTKAAGTGNQSRLWNSDGTANPSVSTSTFTTSWVMTLLATNTQTVDSGKFANIGFTIFNDDNEYLAFLLNANDSGYNLHLEGTGFTAVNVTVADSTDVTMRVSWDAVAKTLTSAYSFDGSSFTDVNSFNPLTGAGVTGSGWSNTTNPVSNGFNLGITGNSDAAGAISVGSIYADNFSVSAVPEPSTYAAIFGGLVLGLAIWRRRQAA